VALPGPSEAYKRRKTGAGFCKSVARCITFCRLRYVVIMACVASQVLSCLANIVREIVSFACCLAFGGSSDRDRPTLPSMALGKCPTTCENGAKPLVRVWERAGKTQFPARVGPLDLCERYPRETFQFPMQA
jgi:hypothetical protein